LTFPITAHLITSVDVATFHSICPMAIERPVRAE
jgi:hypothetical protein